MEGERHAGNLKLLGGRLCLDFANTVDWRAAKPPRDWLTGYADLVAWSQHVGVVTKSEAHHLGDRATRHPGDAAAAFERAIQLRETIYRTFFAVIDGRPPATTDLVTLNDFISDALSRLRLAPTDGGLAWHWADRGESLEWMLWPLAQSAAELLTTEELNRVKTCAGDNCGWLFLDTSKNRRRRWCSMEGCGNRAKGRRHYRRSRAQQKD